MIRRALWTAVFVLAAAGALAPLPGPIVERWYSQGAYPAIQHVLTPVSNLVPFSLFDVLVAATIGILSVASYRSFDRVGWKGRGLHLGASVLKVSAVAYLAFLATWGLNYRRVPLTTTLAFDAGRVTRPAADALAARAVLSLNRLYAAAHGEPTPLPALAASFHEAEQVLHARTLIVPGRPKATLLGGYFHHASIAGMTDPYLLETMLAPDLLDVERPFVIAHEWGHLAGYADESEASFLAWLACTRGDEAAQYSAWLAILGHVQPYVSRGRGPTLDGGPRSDLFAIRYRYSQTSPVLRAAARETYDKYLKANRVQAGVGSYDLVVQLILGTAYDAQGNPSLR